MMTNVQQAVKTAVLMPTALIPLDPTHVHAGMVLQEMVEPVQVMQTTKPALNAVGLVIFPLFFLGKIKTISNCLSNVFHKLL